MKRLHSKLPDDWHFGMNYNAKLSDFGLAKNGPTGDKSHVSTRIMRTYGYPAPEYLATGHLTTRSDVYSFGVVLLEMLSERTFHQRNSNQRALQILDQLEGEVCIYLETGGRRLRT